MNLKTLSPVNIYIQVSMSEQTNQQKQCKVTFTSDGAEKIALIMLKSTKHAIS